MKKIIMISLSLCISTQLNGMLVSRLVSTSPIRTMNKPLQRQYSERYPAITNHLNSLPEEKAIPRLLALLGNNLYDHNEKLSFVKSQLYHRLFNRNDLSPHNKQILTLLEGILDPHQSLSAEPHTLVHLAVTENNVLLAQATLCNCPQDVINIPNNHNNTPLYRSAIRANLPLVKVMLSFEANSNSRNEQKKTPLHGVVTSPLINTNVLSNQNVIAIIECLMQTGANSALADESGKTPMDYIYETLDNLTIQRSQTLFNEDGELMLVYQDMSKKLQNRE